MTLHSAARLAASAGLVLGCGNPTDPNTHRVVGTIDPSLSSAKVIDAPSEVRSGATFTVTVRTVGSCGSSGSARRTPTRCWIRWKFS